MNASATTAGRALVRPGLLARAWRGVLGWARVNRPYLIVLVISSFVVSTWFRTGTFISTGDMGPFIRRGWAPEAVWSWNHSVTGAGSAAYNVARGAEFWLIDFWKALGFDEYVAQWSWYTIIYGLVGFGTAFTAGAFVRSELGIIAAGTFGVLNGFFLTRLPNPLNIISVGTIALMTGVAIRVAQGRRIPAPVAGFVLIPTSFLGFNPPMLVVAYAWAVGGTTVLTLLALGWRPLGRLLWWFVKATPWVLLLNVWWLLPLAQGFTGGGGAVANADFTDPTNWTWAQINNIVPNILTMVANWAWFRPQYLPFAESLDQPYWIWIRYLLPTVVLLAPVLALRRNRRVALVLAAMASVFVFLAKGLMPPLEQINLWLYLHAPGFWLFREPMSKLGQLLILFFAVLIGMFVEGLVARARERRTLWSRISLGAGLAAVVGVVAYPFPLYNGTVMPDERPQQPSAHVRVPDFWWEMAERIDSDPRPGKVLVLPLDDYYQMPTTWGFFGVDSIANLLLRHPVVQPKPDGYFGDVPGFNSNVRAVEAALLSGDFAPVPRLLDAMQVSRVIVRHDLVRGLPGRSFADDRILGAALSQVPGMTQEYSGSLDLWYVGDGSSPTVRTYGRLVDTPYQPDAGAGAIGTMPTDEAILAQDAPKPVAGPRIVDDSPKVSSDVVFWPVPAVAEGDPVEEVSLEGGTYRLGQRSRTAPPLVPTVDEATSSLVLSDPTRVRIDGDVVSKRPPLELPVPTTDVVAVTAGTRTASLDGWGRDTPPSLVIGSATPLTAWAPSDQPADPTEFSEVYDCNNYEPRPASELQLRRDLTQTLEGIVVTLSAKDHAACTRVVLRDAAPGRTYRIRLEYRSLEGKRPQICVWQVGTDGCELAARPVLSDEWTPYEMVVTLDDVAEGMQVILHSDVGQRLLPRTVTEYRDLRIEALDPVLETTVYPPEVPETRVTLDAGTHTLSVTGGLSGSILAPFEDLQDCFRYDDLTPEQAGLFAEVLEDEPQPAYRMGARVHMACVGATAPKMGDTSLYEMSYEARSEALRNPKVCLFLRGPDRCQSIPAQVWTEEWQPYQLLVQPNPDAVETRLYLYGLRDLEEKEQSVVEYRDVRLTPVASTSNVVLIREGPVDSAPTVEWRKENPTRYPVQVDGPDPSVLTLAETYAPGWQLQGLPAGAEKPVHLMVQGWANGWTLPAGATDGSMVYAPARLARYALLLLPVAVFLACAWMLFAAWWRRRRARRRARGLPTGTDRVRRSLSRLIPGRKRPSRSARRSGQEVAS